MVAKDIGLDKIVQGIEPVDGKWIENARKRTGRGLCCCNHNERKFQLLQSSFANKKGFTNPAKPL